MTGAVRLVVSVLVAACVAAPAAAHPGMGHAPWGGPQGGRLGVHIAPMTPELRDYFGAGPDAGVLVSAVDEKGPAARAGLAVGDVIVAADGESIAEPHALVQRVSRVPAGESIALRVVRRGEAQTLRVPVRGDPWPDFAPVERWLQDWGGRGIRELRRQLRELEERLEELEDRVEEQKLEQT